MYTRDEQHTLARQLAYYQHEYNVHLFALQQVTRPNPTGVRGFFTRLFGTMAPEESSTQRYHAGELIVVGEQIRRIQDALARAGMAS